MPKKTILYFVLNWGLGHATRSIPVIRALNEAGHQVIPVSTGRSLDLLRKEFPKNTLHDLPDYDIHYASQGWLLIPRLLLDMPRILFRLALEHQKTERLVRQYQADLIVSDNRYGCYSKQVPSFFMTHQLRFQLPKGLGWSAFISEWFNRFYFRKYEKVFIPDTLEQSNFSGDLSHRGAITSHAKLVYIGGLSSLKPCEKQIQDIDWLIIISGPEPSRTQFEICIRSQSGTLSGKKVVIAGKPECSHADCRHDDDSVQYFSHLNRREMSQMIHRAKIIVTRSGYSTLMELLPLGKTMVLVPTPGQTEQEYLAEYHAQSAACIAVSQKDLNLNDIVLPPAQTENKFKSIPMNQPELILSYF